MPTFLVEYSYDDRSHLRDAHRPEHRAYLGGLLHTGTMVAFGRYDDAGAPGAVLIFEVGSADEVEKLVARDPFVVQGLVPRHTVRQWSATWGEVPASA